MARQIAFAAGDVENARIADAFTDERFETLDQSMAKVARIAQTAVDEVQVEADVLVVNGRAHDCLNRMQ